MKFDIIAITHKDSTSEYTYNIIWISWKEWVSSNMLRNKYAPLFISLICLFTNLFMNWFIKFYPWQSKECPYYLSVWRCWWICCTTRSLCGSWNHGQSWLNFYLASTHPGSGTSMYLKLWSRQFDSVLLRSFLLTGKRVWYNQIKSKLSVTVHGLRKRFQQMLVMWSV